MTAFGNLVKTATVMQPLFMGILVSALIGIALTLPISSAAICIMLSLDGLAGGAATAGCCAQMVGFAVLSFCENKWGGLLAQGLGTSMLQMGNIVRNPKIWIPPVRSPRRSSIWKKFQPVPAWEPAVSSDRSASTPPCREVEIR